MGYQRIERGIFRQSGSPNLFIDWTDPVSKRRYRESARTPSLRKARKLRESRLTDAERGRAIAPEAKKVTLSDIYGLLRDDYETQGHRSWDRAERAWCHISDYFGANGSAMNVTTAALKRYSAARLAQNRQPASVRYELALLRRAFNLAVEFNLLPTAPRVPKLAVDNVRTGFLSESDLGVLLLELPVHLRQPTLWAYAVGWRKEEVFGMRWDWIDEERGDITLPAALSKNKRARPVAYSAMPQLVGILKTQRAHTDTVEQQPTKGPVPWVFHRDGKRIKYHYDAWRAACKRGGLPGLRFHDLRRTAVRNMERAGLSRSAAMSLTGHVTESVYARYAIVDEEVQREALTKLARSVTVPSAMPSQTV